MIWQLKLTNIQGLSHQKTGKLAGKFHELCPKKFKTVDVDAPFSSNKLTIPLSPLH